MDSADFPRTAFGEARRTIGAHAYTAYFPAPLSRSFELPARLVPLLAEAFELGAAGEQPNADVEEVLAYVDAMEWAVTEAPRLPLSNRILDAYSTTITT